MQWFLSFCRSSVGSKVLMAVTGVLLFGFVVFHMLGNLQLFLGQEAVNRYAAALKGLGGLLWVARIGLLAIFLVHVATAIRLARENRQARPVAYAANSTVQATYASRTMVMSGVLVFAFVVYHLLHLTFGVVMPDAYDTVDAQGRHDVFTMTVLGFQNPIVSLSYVVAMVLLGFHLRHGVTSLFQTLGLNHPKYQSTIDKVGPISALVIVVGNISMPLAVLAGIVTLPGGGAS